MKSIRCLLIKRPSKQHGVVVHYWNTKWSDSRGADRYKSHGRCDKVSKVKARALHREFSHELNTGKTKQNKPKRLTLGQFLELDREAIKTEVKPSTLIVHENVSKHAEAAIGADVELTAIDWQHVVDLKNWLGSKHVLGERTLPPCSKATIKKSIVTLKAAFNRAIERELIDTNPFAKEKLAKVQPKQKRIYSLAEVDAMVEAASGIWWKTFIRLAITTGLRFGEIINLVWSDIDEETRQITVSAKRPGQFKVGDRSYPRLAFSTKNHRERNVPLDREAEKLLLRLKAKSGGSIYPFISLQRLALIAATEDVQQEIPAPKLINNAIRDFKTIQIQARANLAKQQDVKLDKIIWEIGSPHDLRKSFATHMAKIIPMNDLRQLLGHASIVTTVDFYAAVDEHVVDKVRAAFTMTVAGSG